MGRILAIDYGRKRVGLAVTDVLGLIPGSLETVPTHTLVDFLKQYCLREPVDCFVVGYPRQADGTESESMRYIRPFLSKLAELFPDKPVHLEDERYTSVIAQRTMIDAGIRREKRQEKGMVDALSAVIILQSYMERMSGYALPTEMPEPPSSMLRKTSAPNHKRKPKNRR